MMQLCFIGTGYVGLVSGVCFAELGYKVTCVDTDEEKIVSLKKGVIPIYEPGLDALVEKATGKGLLQFTTSLAEGMQGAEVIFIAVGTPPGAVEGKADLSYVFAAAEEIAGLLDHEALIVTKSTVPVGTGQRIASIMRKKIASERVHVASNPEFLREGSAIEDFMQPDRIVIGTGDDYSALMLQRLYQPLTARNIPLLSADIETAEMIKYAANTFLATKIAFINEMADICERVGANVELVAKGMGMDSRIGEKFLKPGPGFGGSCFPKDGQALAQLASEVGIRPDITNAVIRYNLGRRESMADRIITACGGSVAGRRIGILGLTFKANTDDMRESPALVIIPRLQAVGAQIAVYDPQGMENAKLLLAGEIEWCARPEDVFANADAIGIVTEWDAFKMLNYEALITQMQQPVIIDMRNLFIPGEMAQFGYRYYSIGRLPAGI